MTEQAASAVPAPADNAAVANAAAASNGSEAAAAGAWWSGLQDEGNRKTAETKGWKDPDTAIKSYTELEKRLTEVSSKALTPPAADAKQEEWDAFHARAGRPEKPEAYEFKLPDGLPADLPYDAEFANQYKAWAHQAGLTPRQAQQQHDAFVKFQADAFQKSVEAHGQKMTAATANLGKVWGEPGSEGFKQNVALADRFIRNNGGEALMGELKANGLLAENGAVLSPVLAQAFSKAGKALYSEDQLVTGQSASGSRTDPAKTLYPHDPFKQG